MGQLVHPNAWRISLLRLGKNPSEAIELAELLHEVAPHILVEGLQRDQEQPPGGRVWRQGSAQLALHRCGLRPARLGAWTPRQRLAAAVAINIGQPRPPTPSLAPAAMCTC
jgi:hypothetical protein